MIPLGVLAQRQAATGGGWTPEGLNLRGWWDASDAATLTLVGSEVSAVADKSGNGYHLLAPNSGARPGTTTVNGLTALTFVYGSDYLRRNSVGTTQPYTVAYVLQSDNAAPAAANYRISSTPAPLTIGIRGFDINKWYMYAGTELRSTVDADTGLHLLVGVVNGASSSLRLDGTQLLAGDAGTGNPGSIGWGGASSASYFGGTSGEFVYANGALTGTDLTNLEDYLMTKWGI